MGEGHAQGIAQIGYKKHNACYVLEVSDLK